MIKFESNSNYLKQEDITTTGQLVQISSPPELETMIDGERKYVLHFHQFEKGLVLNNTNGNVLISLFGEDESKWVGKQIVIYRDPTITYGSKVVGGIRFRMAPPQDATQGAPQGAGAQPQQGPQGAPNDDIPF